MTMFSLESSNPMAVYTTLSSAQVSAYLSPFNLGELIELRGISGGIENTNYFVTTQVKGQPPQAFVLTLFEDLDYEEMPYFIGLTEHLVAHNVTVPAPLRNETGTALSLLAGKPTLLFPRFAGDHLARSEIGKNECAIMGQELASLHVAGQGFATQRQSHRGPLWWNELGPRAAQCIEGEDATMLMMAIGQYDAMQSQQPNLPTGVIHGDLFHDNALFNEGKLSATIDLYNASNDYLLFDVAITVNDWCISADGSIAPHLYNAFLDAYANIRAFTPLEQQYWNAMLIAAAMRFWLSRLETFHSLDNHQREEGVTVLKEPDVFRDILRHRMQKFHQLP
ncbi:MAG: homoserine kinase [Gammaproteobacteria bacterium]|jgi:homoserine kinase type II|tara:strand:- start:737 stop:1747 length:1011 start_codon:yes stop_codon:yes gene_type:complete